MSGRQLSVRSVFCNMLRRSRTNVVAYARSGWSKTSQILRRPSMQALELGNNGVKS